MMCTVKIKSVTAGGGGIWGIWANFLFYCCVNHKVTGQDTSTGKVPFQPTCKVCITEKNDKVD